MKYLLIKAWLGFGDRLQGLKMCVNYALKHNLAIYVDWSDSIFCHSEESFYTYFNLKLPTFKIEDLQGSVYPPYWKDKLNEKLTESNQIPEINIGVLDQVYNADIIVYCCIGNRLIYNNSSFFGKVFKVIHPEILREVHQRQQIYNLSQKIGVHLRGTDRTTKINKLDRFRGIRLRMSSLGSLSGQQFIALTDDEDFARMWKTNFNFPLLTKIIPGGSAGNHQISAANLGLTKNDLNIDMLIDFFTLASCKDILSTSKDSRFAQEAQRLSPLITDILSN
jgi:uncharacterized LabA/DUF88 family protein